MTTPGKKIPQLPTLTDVAADDYIVVSDTSASAATKKVAAGGVFILKTAVIVLSDDDIKALPTTPFALVSAAPSGYRNKLIGATIMVNIGGGAYGNVNGDYAAVQVVESTGAFLTGSVLNTTGLIGGASLADLTQLLSGSPGQRLFDFPIAALAARVYDASDYAEIQGGLAGIGTPGLNLSMDNNGSGNLTDGDPANYARVTVYYAIEQTL